MLLQSLWYVYKLYIYTSTHAESSAGRKDFHGHGAMKLHAESTPRGVARH